MTLEPVRVKWTISLGFVTAERRGEFEVDRTEWDERTPTERAALLNEMYQEEINNYIDGGWSLENADLDDPVVVTD